MTLLPQSFKVGLLGGTGAEGRGLALRFAAAGLPVAIGSRQAERAREAASRINTLLAGRAGVHAVDGGTNHEVAAHAEFVFLTLPFNHAPDLLVGCRGVFQSGTVVVDVTVPLLFAAGEVRLLSPPEGSGSRSLERLLPQGVLLVAAFKTVPAHILAQLDVRLDCDIVVCGDSQDARRRTLELLGIFQDIRALDGGSLDSAVALEHMCALAVRLNRKYKVKGSRFRIVGL